MAYVGQRETGHTHTKYDKNNTTNDHTKNHPLHLTTIEGGAATVRTTSHTRVGEQVKKAKKGALPQKRRRSSSQLVTSPE